jgi:hypothetical protein
VRALLPRHRKKQISGEDLCNIAPQSRPPADPQEHSRKVASHDSPDFNIAPFPGIAHKVQQQYDARRAQHFPSRGVMESPEDMMTVIRYLKELRHAKRKEEKKEHARLEQLKLRVLAKLNRGAQPPDGEPIRNIA